MSAFGLPIPKGIHSTGGMSKVEVSSNPFILVITGSSAARSSSMCCGHLSIVVFEEMISSPHTIGVMQWNSRTVLTAVRRALTCIALTDVTFAVIVSKGDGRTLNVFTTSALV